MLHNIVCSIIACVCLNMDKPPDCNVELDECPPSVFQYGGVESMGYIKLVLLICIHYVAEYNKVTNVFCANTRLN